MPTKIELLNTRTKSDLFSLASSAELSVRKTASKTDLVNALNRSTKVKKADLVPLNTTKVTVKAQKSRAVKRSAKARPAARRAARRSAAKARSTRRTARSTRAPRRRKR